MDIMRFCASEKQFKTIRLSGLLSNTYIDEHKNPY